MKELESLKSSGGFRGLMVKDFKFVLKNRAFLTVLLIIEVMFFTMQGIASASFVMAYMIMGCSMLVLNTITMDEQDKSMVFLMTMPVSRKEYVLEKYALSFFCTLFGCAVALLPCFVLKPAGIGELLAQSAGILAAMLLLQMVVLPTQLKFGGEKGRVVLACIFAVMVLLAVFVEKMGNRYLGQAGMLALEERISSGIDSLCRMENICIALAVCAICFWISFRISKGIMEKKEF